ncbi:Protein will die slowly [Gryllus bimaculatus]|nr:Protein will die slowly [Gryllus bimaculatus]
MIKCLEDLRSGIVEPSALVSAERTKRAYNLQLSKYRDIESVHSSGVNSLDLDVVEKHYLLSGCADGTVYIHDLYNFTGLPQYTSKLICSVDKTSRSAHQYSVECVQWYPFDNGLFVSSGMDKKLKIWDANCLKPAEQICLEGRIFQHHMSPIGSKQCLVAVASSASEVILVDLKSGCYSHELRGHSGSVLTCRWSPREENIVATGSCDNKVILWDVRSSKCFLKSFCLYSTDNQSGSQLTSTAHDGYVNGLCFTADGLFLLSYGTDNRLQLWDAYTGENQMVNYGDIPNRTKKCVQFAVSVNTNPILAYVPSEGNIFVFELHTGLKVKTLLGHYSSVNGCIYHPFLQEVYSAGNDRNILLWSADTQGLIYDEHTKSQVPVKSDSLRSVYYKKNVTLDTWSSDEDS